MQDFKEKLEELKFLTIAKKRKKTINKLRKKLNIPVEENPEVTLEGYVKNLYSKAEEYISKLNQYLSECKENGAPTNLKKDEYDSVGEFLLLYKAKVFFENPHVDNYHIIKLPQDFKQSEVYSTYEIQRLTVKDISQYSNHRPKSYKGKIRK